MKKIIVFFLAFSIFFCAKQSVFAASCGAFYDPNTAACQCVHSEPASSNGQSCCGWIQNAGPNESCSPTTTVSCGTAVPAAPQYNSVLCPASCQSTGTYTSGGVTQRCCGWQNKVGTQETTCSSSPTVSYTCGQEYFPSGAGSQVIQQCTCAASGTTGPTSSGASCCGFTYNDGSCHATAQPAGQVTCGTQLTSQESAGKTCGCTNKGFDVDGSTVCCGWWNKTRQTCTSTQTLVQQCSSQTYSSTQNVDCKCASGEQFFANNQLCCGWVTQTNGLKCEASQTTSVSCGTDMPSANSAGAVCGCTGGHTEVHNGNRVCCGWWDTASNSCKSQPVTGGNSGNGGNGGNGTGTDPGLTAATLANLNSAIFGGAPDAQLTTPRGIISKLLPYLFTFGGLILFIMLIWGGFEMLTGAANPKSQEAGKQRITAAIIGFILLFSSYWLAQLVQTIFGLTIL